MGKEERRRGSAGLKVKTMVATMKEQRNCMSTSIEALVRESKRSRRAR
jgi:hypothetical protein